MTITSKNNWVYIISPVVFIFVVCSVIAFYFRLNSNPLLSTGIAVDLTITAPVLYFLLIRKSSISKLTVLRVFIAGIVLASFLLHNKSISYLIVLRKWIVPVIELGTIASLVNNFVIAKKALKNERNEAIDFLEYCRNILTKMFGNEKIANILASEFSVIYYLIIWKNVVENNSTVFSYHKTSNIRLILATFIGLIMAETIGFHFLLTIWSVTTAWIFSAFSFYTCLQLLAHIKAVKYRPVLISKQIVSLHNGLAGDVNIDIQNISAIELHNKNIVGNSVVKLSLLKGLEKHNVTIYLKQPVDVIRMFGVKKKADIILLHVDNAKDFINAIKRTEVKF